MNRNKYFTAAFSSFFIWGFFSLAIKKINDYASLDILFYRVFYATFLLLMINFIFRRQIVLDDLKIFNSFSKSVQRKTVVLTIIGGFLLVLNWFLFMYSVNHISIQSASFAYLICPIITTVLAYFVLKEKLNKKQWTAVGLFVVSCGLLSYGHIKDLMYSLIIASTFALYLITQRRNNYFDRFVVLTIQLLISSIILSPFYCFYKSETPTTFLFWGVMTCIVVLFTIIPLFLNLYALKGIDSKTVGVLMYTNPLINFFLALFYFKEEINVIQLSAYLLIVVAIILFNINYFAKKAN
ncbi:threonine and homoserine efflux system [Flavobacterium columnare]|uniref:EamA family transporter n=2 Tax=Flavobacterium TaxID=237 RepID=A0ABW8PQI2_9FLAO|nr:EamA family transporter [Flavobacterium columnare]SPE78192.1 threonine and homoserine efflux system [Flavobacterium columnare]